jgi:hypothetical protein
MLFGSLRIDEMNLKRRRVCLLRYLTHFYVHIEASDLSLHSVEISKLEFMFKICHQALQTNGTVKRLIARNGHNKTSIILHILIASISMMDGNQKNSIIS